MYIGEVFSSLIFQKRSNLEFSHALLQQQHTHIWCEIVSERQFSKIFMVDNLTSCANTNHHL